MTLKVRKFGKSLGIILPEEACERLETSEGQSLVLLAEPGGRYRLTTGDDTFEMKLTKADSLIDRYHNTLNTLAN